MVDDARCVRLANTYLEETGGETGGHGCYERRKGGDVEDDRCRKGCVEKNSNQRRRRATNDIELQRRWSSDFEILALAGSLSAQMALKLWPVSCDEARRHTNNLNSSNFRGRTRHGFALTARLPDFRPETDRFRKRARCCIGRKDQSFLYFIAMVWAV